MGITQHPAIKAYFAAESDAGMGNVDNIFADDASVTDEGKTIFGIDAITAWKQAAKKNYQYTAEPLGSKESDTRSVMQVRLCGNFPGSPVIVTYTFVLHDGKITALEIK
jgi:hypothetical protein